MKEIVLGGLNSRKLSYPLKLPFLSNRSNWWDWQDTEAHSRMFHFQWVLWRLVDKTWMPLVFQASKVSSKAPRCQNYHHSGTKLSVITGAELRHNELPNFHWTLLHWTYLSQQRGWPTAVSQPPTEFYKICLSTLSLSVFISIFFRFVLPFHLKKQLFSRRTLQKIADLPLPNSLNRWNCTMLPNFSSKYPQNWYYISWFFKPKEFDATVDCVLWSTEGVHNNWLALVDILWCWIKEKERVVRNWHTNSPHHF